jgi:hypothetical protein
MWLRHERVVALTSTRDGWTMRFHQGEHQLFRSRKLKLLYAGYRPPVFSVSSSFIALMSSFVI